MKHGVMPADQLREDRRINRFGQEKYGHEPQSAEKILGELNEGGPVNVQHSVLSIYTQSLKEILRHFGEDVRFLEVQKNKSDPNMSTDEIRELGLKVTSKVTKNLFMQYEKGTHATLKQSWKERLLEKLKDYNIDDVPVNHLWLELNNEEINEQVEKFATSEAGKRVYPNRWEEFQDYNDGVIGLFQSRKAKSHLDRERWGVSDYISEYGHEENLELLNKGFKRMTLDLRVLLPKKDFLGSIPEKHRIYFVDWTQEEIHDRRSERGIVSSIKRSINFTDRRGRGYCKLKGFKVGEDENLKYRALGDY